jgi:excisionase family DNA binding protein
LIWPRTAPFEELAVVLYSVKQAAQLLSGSVALVYHLCAVGALRHTRIGVPGRRGVIRIPQDAIDDYLKGREVGMTPPPATRRKITLENLKLS